MSETARGSAPDGTTSSGRALLTLAESLPSPSWRAKEIVLEQAGLDAASGPGGDVVIERYSRGVLAYFGRTPAHSLRLTLRIAPRTKKNHGRAFGIKQSFAYKHFRDEVIAALGPIAFVYGRPLLPALEDGYNIAATYYVDKPGEQADKCGLDQGLYDALQNAGLIADDWYFRTDDGTRIVFGDELPRVDVLITPLHPGT